MKPFLFMSCSVYLECWVVSSSACTSFCTRNPVRHPSCSPWVAGRCRPLQWHVYTLVEIYGRCTETTSRLSTITLTWYACTQLHGV